MIGINLKEFKPTIRFLAIFVGLYVVLNLLYGVFLLSYFPNPDPVTRFVTNNTLMVLSLWTDGVYASDHPTKPTTLLLENGHGIVSVYEGCNGINSMIIFFAFLVAFGPLSKQMFWFIPVGLLAIHLTNLVRISFLYYVAREWPDAMYFFHKYLFTAVIYGVVILLWYVWIARRPSPTAS